MRDKELEDLGKKLNVCSEQLVLANKNAGDKAGLEAKLEEQDSMMKVLKQENSEMKHKQDDLLDELSSKNVEMKDLETQISNTSLKSSASSLNEELQQVNMFDCTHCSSNFATDGELKAHKRSLQEEKVSLKIDLMNTVIELERKISEQKLKCTSSLFELKSKEIEEIQTCRCKSYCTITHVKHNYMKSKSDGLFSKLSILSSNLEPSKEAKACNFGARRKQYTCNQCDEVFNKQGQLKKHKKSEHRVRERENVEVQQYGQKGRMS